MAVAAKNRGEETNGMFTPLPVESGMKKWSGSMEFLECGMRVKHALAT